MGPAAEAEGCAVAGHRPQGRPQQQLHHGQRPRSVPGLPMPARRAAGGAAPDRQPAARADGARGPPQAPARGPVRQAPALGRRQLPAHVRVPVGLPGSLHPQEAAARAEIRPAERRPGRPQGGGCHSREARPQSRLARLGSRRRLGAGPRATGCGRAAGAGIGARGPPAPAERLPVTASQVAAQAARGPARATPRLVEATGPGGRAAKAWLPPRGGSPPCWPPVLPEWTASQEGPPCQLLRASHPMERPGDQCVCRHLGPAPRWPSRHASSTTAIGRT
mmetsp:Transcript_68138/g.211686  ORF Transcript_68138/g.211686 Transcript_68138/m.211686 type:complete len:278 (-) Transcript_68138:36-869(-)